MERDKRPSEEPGISLFDRAGDVSHLQGKECASVVPKPTRNMQRQKTRNETYPLHQNLQRIKANIKNKQGQALEENTLLYILGQKGFSRGETSPRDRQAKFLLLSYK